MSEYEDATTEHIRSSIHQARLINDHSQQNAAKSRAHSLAAQSVAILSVADAIREASRALANVGLASDKDADVKVGSIDPQDAVMYNPVTLTDARKADLDFRVKSLIREFGVLNVADALLNNIKHQGNQQAVIDIMQRQVMNGGFKP